MDRFEDGLHRGFGHDDDFTSDELAAISEIAATYQRDAAERDQADKSGMTAAMRAKRSNQREY